MIVSVHPRFPGKEGVVRVRGDGGDGGDGRLLKRSSPTDGGPLTCSACVALFPFFLRDISARGLGTTGPPADFLLLRLLLFICFISTYQDYWLVCKQLCLTVSVIQANVHLFSSRVKFLPSDQSINQPWFYIKCLDIIYICIMKNLSLYEEINQTFGNRNGAFSSFFFVSLPRNVVIWIRIHR